MTGYSSEWSKHNQNAWDPKNDKVKSDYEYSRDTYYELLEKGKDSLETMMEVARESEHPRAFEVLSNMIKNLSDVNDRLMDLNKKNRDLEEPLKKVEKQQNNIFLGSTSELQKLLREQNEEKVVDAKPSTDLPRES
tara:strand:- start:149 stop:556 length:408 start_codon:yes stop_codon:yes gene_type:complete